MKLSNLLKNVKVEEMLNFKDVDINVVTDKSANAKENTMFCCVVGEKYDAHKFINEISKNGCKVFLVEKINKALPSELIQIKVYSVREQMCVVLANFYDNVQNKMTFIGVTGTNGKTSITLMLKYTLEKLKNNVGVIGTTGYYIGTKKYETKLTTPDSVDLFKIFDIMQKNAVKIVIMEVSAHSIYLNKIFGIRFFAGIFTNLTQDHLDFFGTMENYAKTKHKFLLEYCDNVIINIDDEYGKKFKFNGKTKTYSIKKKANIYANDITYSLRKVKFNVCKNGQMYKFSYPNGGEHNIYNILAVLQCVSLLGYKLGKLKKIIAHIPQIAGRLDFVKVQDFLVCIDYAHTPDALEKVLTTIRPFTKDLIVIFGSSGNRDSLKRRKMGIIVNEYADYVVLTSDNPRFEKETDIIADLSFGITKPYAVETDRTKAIKFATEIAKKDSVVLICGKGVETYQDIKANKVPYSDYEEVEKYK